jgi:hypothetical protein
MKSSFPVNLLSTAIFSLWLVNGCAYSADKAAPASKASPEATAAIASANSAIKQAKANNWIWRDTGKFVKQAQAAADKGDNAAAIKLAKRARAQAEDAVKQYEYEKANPRGL